MSASAPLAAVTTSWPRSASTSFSVNRTAGSSSTTSTLPTRPGSLDRPRADAFAGKWNRTVVPTPGSLSIGEVAPVLPHDGAGHHEAEAGAALARGEERRPHAR